MKIPFFDLKGDGPKLKREELQGSIDMIFDLIKVSNDNNKKIKKIIMSQSVRCELLGNVCYGEAVSKGKLFGYVIEVIPDIAVIWEKEKK